MTSNGASRPNAPARLGIGRIGAPHGLEGRVHAKLDSSQSESLALVKRVTLVFPDGRARELELAGLGGSGAHALLAFSGIEDRDAAASLRGARIEVERAALPPLAAGEYYLVDLVGATVVVAEREVGTVLRVVVNPSVDSVIIRLADGREVEQALAPPWLVGVDAVARRVELANLEGLIR